MKKAVAYARFSSDNQRHESIDAQIRAIKEYSAKNNIQLLKIYQDAAQSATTDKREQFLQMMSDAKSKTFDCVIVHKLDRFSRDRYDSAYYKKLLKDHGISLISVMEQIDDSPESIILESVLEGMAEYYSKNLAREVNKGLKENALRSLHNGGIPPLGYNVVNQKYVINEKEAASVVLIFELYSQGHGYSDIVNQLNNLGYKTKTGSCFGKNSIADLLLNEKYTGTYVFNKRLSKKSGNRKYKPEEEIIKIENAIPPIITRELWDKAQLRRQKRVSTRHIESREYILTGKIRCGICGGAYTGAGYSKSKKEYNYHYKCVQRKRSKQCTNLPVNALSIEQYIIGEIIKNHLSTEAIDGIANVINEILARRNSNTKDEKKPLLNQLKTLQGRRDKLMELFFDNIIEKDVLYKDLSVIDQQISSTNESLNLIPLVTPKIEIDTKGVVRLLNKLLERANAGDPKINKILIDSFVKEVIIHKDSIDIILYRIPIDFVPPGRDKTGGSEGSRTPVQIVSTFKRLQFSLTW